MRNILTFDVEDYFQVSAFAEQVKTEQWELYPSRVAQNVDKILGFLAEHNCLATFFTLGWVAENHPEVVVRIAKSGHEIACHSHRHRRVFEMTPDEFREDTRRAKCMLEDVSGKKVLGYRAPSFSITKDSVWAFEVLAELGFVYDSSIFPVRHPNYGIADAGRGAFVVNTESGSIVEFPMSTLEFGPLRAPFGGGAYLRLLPYWYTRWGIRYLNRCEGRFACVYAHPWEADPEQPRLDGDLTARVRHTLGLGGMEAKLGSLLRDFEFCPMGSLLDTVQERMSPAVVNK